MTPKVAHIAIALPVEGHFDYAIPETLQEKVRLGQRVSVPFRREKKTGFVVGLAPASIFKTLKPIIKILDAGPSLSKEFLALGKSFAEYYGCSIGEALDTMLPDSLRTSRVLAVEFSDTEIPPRPQTETVLLHDPTFEKRWEVVNEEIQDALKKGKGVIVLTPEVFQVQPIVDRLQKQLKVPVIILDKQLKAKDEMRDWILLRQNKSPVAVGTRSAVFAPVVNLGLIVVLDEENNAYKQEQSPSYQASDVARMRAEICGAKLLLVSASPRAEIWQAALAGKARKISLPAQPHVQTQIVDLNNYNPQKTSIFSFPLRNIMDKILAEKGKAVLILNRRGFSSMTRCNQCGHSLKCGRCNIPLTYLFSKRKMVCRRCNSETDIPKVCPSCKSSYLRSVGTGIEKLESDLARIYPTIRISRFDRDSVRYPAESDIVVATQAAFRYLENSPPEMVALLQFDDELNRVDFRSAQKAFSVLVYLQHIAKKKLVIQTYQPDSYIIQSAIKMDFDSFYREELKFREELRLPPFTHFVAIGLRGVKEEDVLKQAHDLYEALMQQHLKGVEVSEPQPSGVAKLRDKFRFTIMLKAASQADILSLAKAVLSDFKRKKDVILTVHVNP